MSRGVQRARVDTSQPDIVIALRKAGMSVSSLAAVGNGVPDLIAGYRGINVLLEVKTGDRDCDRKLTVRESKWHEGWIGQKAIVSTPEEALAAVYDHTKVALG